jgi:hypothetical protein
LKLRANLQEQFDSKPGKKVYHPLMQSGTKFIDGLLLLRETAPLRDAYIARARALISNIIRTKFSAKFSIMIAHDLPCKNTQLATQLPHLRHACDLAVRNGYAGAIKPKTGVHHSQHIHYIQNTFNYIQNKFYGFLQPIPQATEPPRR